MQSREQVFSAELRRVLKKHFRARLGRVCVWSETNVLIRAICETVVRELVLLPLAVYPVQIKKVVLQHLDVHEESADDDGSFASSAALNALGESCACERTMLADRKQDFPTALSKLKQL
eukprot:6198498-Pleurochrysis_carterae.AAC.2